jgi:hypothetical protein
MITIYGIIMSKMSKSKRKPMHGVGINDADYITNVKKEGKTVQCPYYKRWASMIERCYSKKLHARHPSYADCFVCDEWLIFSVFKSWMTKQDWHGNELDKDIITSGNKIYSPSTCAFISSNVNSLILDSASRRGDLPIGVSLLKSGRFRSDIRIDGKLLYLGSFDSEKLASDAYKLKKNELIKLAARKQKDQRVKYGLLSRLYAL